VAGPLEINVTTKFVATLVIRSWLRVDANIDNRGTGLDPICLNHFGPSNRCNDDVSPPAMTRKVVGARMAGGHSSVHRLEQVCDRHADDIGATKNHNFFAGDLDIGTLQ